MRTIRSHVAAPTERLSEAFPGVSSLYIEAELREAVSKARSAGIDLRHSVVHVSPDGVEIVDRDEQIALLRHAGVRELASQLQRAHVPAGSLLAYVDLEGAAWTAVSKIADVLGEGDR